MVITGKTDLPVGFGKLYRHTHKTKDNVQPISPPTTVSCSRCDSTPTHDRSQCRGKCEKQGHYTRACQTAKIRVVHKTEEAPLMGVMTTRE